MTLVPTPGTIFAKRQFSYGTQMHFSLPELSQASMDLQLWDVFGSLINQELSSCPIRTVFNYSANFNVVEETCRKLPISPKAAGKTGG